MNTKRRHVARLKRDCCLSGALLIVRSRRNHDERRLAAQELGTNEANSVPAKGTLQQGTPHTRTPRGDIRGLGLEFLYLSIWVSHVPIRG